MKKIELLSKLNDIAPISLQEEWDNCGMQLDFGKTDIKKVLVAMEITNDVIDTAIDAGVDMIITHHPLLFEPVKSIYSFDIKGNYIIRLISNGIEVYSAHTCFDTVSGGNNDYILSLLGVQKITSLVGDMARIGSLKRSQSFKAFSDFVIETLDAKNSARLIGDLNKPIKTVAVCTGSGGEYFSSSMYAGADLFITGEIKHHEAMAIKESGLCAIELGHAASEWIFTPNMASKLRGSKTLKVIEYKDKQIPYNK